MCGATSRVMKKVPDRLTAMTESHASSLVLRSDASRVMPALFTSTSMRSARDSAVATTDFTDCASATSRPRPIAPPPRARAVASDASASTIGNDDTRALGGERLRGGASDAARAAGDESDLTAESTHESSS